LTYIDYLHITRDKIEALARPKSSGLPKNEPSGIWPPHMRDCPVPAVCRHAWGRTCSVDRRTPDGFAAEPSSLKRRHQVVISLLLGKEEDRVLHGKTV